ncbi:MAG: bifunctional adenosylcobinamide kinase/adenosylcobinamide-phosphate guanylyltransferase [Planctomycetes bacterium]|nr:bifunctional adenosylcobinamide kinase/adenosylcobinamide-phosphate guanylyltransferase [Planctomycetota bacterium]
MAKIIFITGGERSGKSAHAQKIALSLSKKPAYVATARIWDDDFRTRIERHKKDRGDEWINIEEEKRIGSIDIEKKVVVIDCVTLWLTNYFCDSKYDVECSFDEAKREFEKISSKSGTLIFISNEIGMGVHAHSEAGRKFTELQGWMNQYIAARAEKAILMVSGIPVVIKGS